MAERLGFERDEALTLGKAVAGLTAQSKGQRLGIFTPSPVEVRRKRAEKAKAAGVFAVALPAVRAAMTKLAKSRPPEALAEEAFRLYEEFRPGVPAGESGWGRRGR